MNLKELIFGEGVHAGGSGGVYRDSVQAWLTIKNITKDNRFVKIVEVLPVNIYLKSAIDRQNIISSFASYLQIAPDELQMIARTLPADTQAYVEQMQRYAEQEENEACREMIEDNIREIGHGIAGGAMRHRFFLVFQYEASMRAKRNTVDSIIQRLNEEADTARRYLDVCASCNRGVLVEQDIGLCTLPDQLIFGFALEERRMHSSRCKDTLLLFKIFVIAVCDIYVHNLFAPALIAPS